MFNQIFLGIVFLITLIIWQTPANAQATNIIKDSFYFMKDDGEFSAEEKDEEAEYIHNLCQQNFFQRTYFDCACIAGAFRQERDKPDLIPQAMLFNNLFNDKNLDCANTSSIAGDTYEFCTDYTFYSRPRVKEELNEQYCRCVANKTANEFKKNPSLELRHIQNIRGESLLSCDEQS